MLEVWLVLWWGDREENSQTPTPWGWGLILACLRVGVRSTIPHKPAPATSHPPHPQLNNPSTQHHSAAHTPRKTLKKC